MIRSVRTRRIDDERPLLTILAGLDPSPSGRSDGPRDPRTVFIQDGEGLVSAGSTAEVVVPAGPGALRSARDAFDALTGGAVVDDGVRLPGTGLVAVGSFAFDPSASTTRSVLRVPRTIIGRRDGVTWRTDIVGADESDGSAAPPTGSPMTSRGHCTQHQAATARAAPGATAAVGDRRILLQLQGEQRPA